MAITWVIRKKEPSSKVGIKFRSQKKRVTIAEVTGRAAEFTDLVPDLKVLEVNGEDVQSASECCKIIREAPAGNIRVVTEGKHHTATKLSKNQYCGFEVQPNLTTKNYVEISRVDPDGMFPDLVSGHFVWSINGFKITNVMQAIKLLKSKSTIKLVAVDPEKLKNVAPGLVKVNSLAAGDINIED
jgi:PDZ domain-containing secreted protein